LPGNGLFAARFGTGRGRRIPRISFKFDSRSTLNFAQIRAAGLQTTLDFTT